MKVMAERLDHGIPISMDEYRRCRDHAKTERFKLVLKYKGYQDERPRCRLHALVGDFASGGLLAQLDCGRNERKARSYFGDANHRCMKLIF